MATRMLATAVLTAALLTACAAPDEAAPTPTAPDDATIAWVDGVCQANQLLARNPPSPPPNPTTEAERPAVVAYLTDVRDRFTQAATLLDGLDPTPTGEKVVSHLRTVVREQADTFAEYLRNAELFPASEVGAPYRLALVETATWTAGSPSLTELTTSDPTVAAAAEQAPNC